MFEGAILCLLDYAEPTARRPSSRLFIKLIVRRNYENLVQVRSTWCARGMPRH